MKKEYCEIFNACFPQFRMGPELFSELIQTDKAEFIEKLEGDKIVGFAAVEDQYLRLICVEPGSRAAGIGKKLLAEAEACIKKNGFDKVIVGGSNSRLFIGAVSDSFGFFEKCGYLRTNQYEEMLMKLSDFSLEDCKLHGHDIAEYGWFDGSLEEIREAVATVDESWVSLYKEDTKVFVGRVDGEIACFCMVEVDARNYLTESCGRVGMPGCVGTVPKFRNKGIALEMIALATQYLKEIGMDVSFIFYTGVAPWYAKLGYKTFLTEVFCEKEI